MPKFNRRGNTGVYYVPTIANPAAPTVAEITAGTPLHGSLAALTGFTSEQGTIPVPVLSDTWDGTIPGAETAAASSLTFYAGDEDADDGEAIRAALVEGDNGFVVWVKRTKVPVSGEPVDVFPAQVMASNDEYSVDNAAARFVVGFAIPDPPVKNVAVAA